MQLLLHQVHTQLRKHSILNLSALMSSVPAADVPIGEQRRSSSESSKRCKRRKTEEKARHKPEYTIAKGYRHVKPYVFEYTTYAKQRWFDRTLLEVFTKEFAAFSKLYYVEAITTGRLTVNGRRASCEQKIKNSDYIVHKTHRHEPPVSAKGITIEYETDDIVVVSKPSSIPVHPCGSYNYNSVTHILQDIRPDLGRLNVVHRLDRLTSGLLILSKNGDTSRRLQKCMEGRSVSKKYVARVFGQFPKSSAQANFQESIDSICKEAVIEWVDDKSVKVSCPLRCRDPRNGVWECHKEGKPAETLITFIRTVGENSIVKCEPVTGRTHQIRLHLQLLGFPIANDPCYGGRLHYGDSERLELLASAEESLQKILNVTQVPDDLSPQKEGEDIDAFVQRTCKWCKTGNSYIKDVQHCSCIWLHALEYKIDDTHYTVPYPDWFDH